MAPILAFRFVLVIFYFKNFTGNFLDDKSMQADIDNMHYLRVVIKIQDELSVGNL